MDSKKDIEAKINERLAKWQPPFGENSKVDAKSAVLNRIQGLDDEEPLISKSNSRILFRIAAVLAIVFGAGFAYYYSGSENFINNSKAVRTYTLPDGSEVVASPKTQIAFNSVMWAWDRNVRFSGEGYFKVKSGNTFTVTTKSGKIHVLGTEFTTWTSVSHLFVHCSKGSVNVESDIESTTLVANEFTRIDKGKLSAKQRYEYAGFVVPPVESQISFDSVPVGIVIAHLEKALSIDINNELPGELVYSGILDTRTQSQCFEVFCKPFGAKITNHVDGSVSIHLK